MQQHIGVAVAVAVAACAMCLVPRAPCLAAVSRLAAAFRFRRALSLFFLCCCCCVYSWSPEPAQWDWHSEPRRVGEFSALLLLYTFSSINKEEMCAHPLTHTHTLPYTRTNTHTPEPTLCFELCGPRTFWRLGVNFFYALPKIISNTLPPARVVLVVLVLLLLLCAIVAVFQLIIVVVVVVLSLLLSVWWEGSKKRRRFRNVYSFRRVYEVNWKGHSVAQAACGTLWLWRHDRTNTVRSWQRSSTISLTRCTPVWQSKPAPSFVSVWQLERACAAQQERESEKVKEKDRERAQSESSASSAGQLRGDFVFIFIWQLMILPVRIALRRLPVLFRGLHFSLTRSLLRIQIEIHLEKTLKVCHNSKLRLLLLMSRAYCVTHLIKRPKQAAAHQAQTAQRVQGVVPFSLPALPTLPIHINGSIRLPLLAGNEGKSVLKRNWSCNAAGSSGSGSGRGWGRGTHGQAGHRRRQRMTGRCRN